VLALGRDGAAGGSVELQFHGGPVQPAELRATAPELEGMLYASLWGWLRALAIGLRALLDFWQGVVGNWGLAIMLLSLSVKVLMWPLTWIAERWQAEVNRQQSVLAPELAAIKREFKGEEAHNLTLEVYRRHGVSQFYTLKSLAGFLVQIPVFIAAFDMLGENFALAGASFLWAQDLSLPDRVSALPGVLPFFGGHLNLLPVLMTVFTILAARLQEDPSLAPALRAGQRLRLYGMGLLFFVLLYTFPAGMVLYWTTNNLLHLVKILFGRAVARGPGTPGTSVIK
jgi:YidC/Oxa1 family membrane protein insertase